MRSEYMDSLEDLSISSCDLTDEQREALQYIVDRERRIQNVTEHLAETIDTDEALNAIKLLVTILEEDIRYE